VPNEAIIEREGSQVVYMQRQPGQFDPVEIRTGLKGELYTEVLDGLAEGDHVVTLGSFFIDADYRLKADPSSAAGNAHHNH
jgi:Cu(I)/Ag(I) efflux system membrane fusion protein